ncbi:tetratricopeptide repeat protein [Streptomyces collinus]|uniref:tetratricopeptide repeat protein n=1 Tax=Streptomyces collinus TaxID=42684 RepID=UPI00382DA012
MNIVERWQGYSGGGEQMGIESEEEFEAGQAALAALRLRLDNARATRGMNKSELARAAGLGRTTVSQALSHNAPPPTKDTISALAHVLRLPPAPLLELLAAGANEGGRERPGKAIGSSIADPDSARMTDSSGAWHDILGGAASGTPHLLTAAPRWFIGRADELGALSAACLEPSPRSHQPITITVITGAGGIGKTALALQWAHEHADHFPDGHLYVNLRGFDPSDNPLAPDSALRSFLVGLGVPYAAIPVDVHAQAAMFRNLLINKRLLVVLDNAYDTSQVLPLLPGSSTCAVIVTSRNKMPGLMSRHGARILQLGALRHEEATELLHTRIGAQRVNAEPNAAAELLRQCAGYPLALSVIIGQAETHPEFPLTVLAEELYDATTRLTAISDTEPESNFSAVISWSYQTLTLQQAKVFRLLSMAPGADIGVSAAASMAALGPSEIKGILRELEQCSLLQQPTPGRYRMHDLIRLYAGSLARQEDDPSSLELSLRRLIDFYLHTAHSGSELLHHYHYPPVQIGQFAPGCRPIPLLDKAASWAWFEAEHACLLAAQKQAHEHGWNTHVWQLAWVTETYHRWSGLASDRLAAWQVALSACQREGDSMSMPLVLRFLGWSYSRVGDFDAARSTLQKALEAAEESGDIFGQAHGHFVSGVVDHEAELYLESLEHDIQALALFRQLGEPPWVALTLNNLGWANALLGNYDEARAFLAEAMTILSHHPDDNNESATLDSLGYVAFKSGDFRQALEYYKQSLVLSRTLQHKFDEAIGQEHIAEAYAALGELDRAIRAWLRSRELYRAQYRSRDADRIEARLCLHRKETESAVGFRIPEGSGESSSDGLTGGSRDASR